MVQSTVLYGLCGNFDLYQVVKNGHWFRFDEVITMSLWLPFIVSLDQLGLRATCFNCNFKVVRNMPRCSELYIILLEM